jgi:hypothetical protein
MFLRRNRARLLGLSLLTLASALAGCQPMGPPVTDGKTVYPTGAMAPMRKTAPDAGAVGGAGNSQPGAAGKAHGNNGAGDG